MIHPTAIIGGPPEHRHHDAGSPMFFPQIGDGCRINAFVTVDSGTGRHTTLGRNCFLLTKSHVGHDAILGDDCEIATGAVIGGWCELGDRVRVGLNATVRPRVKVGDGARIGMGSVVTKDVPAGAVWVGNPGAPLGDPRDRRLLWAAGLFEGEGWIYINRSKTRYTSKKTGETKETVYLSPRMGLESTDLDMVERFHFAVGCGRLVGVRTRDNRFPNAKPIYRWAASGRQEVITLASRLRPHLGQRRNHQIDGVLAECGCIDLATDDEMWTEQYERGRAA